MQSLLLVLLSCVLTATGQVAFKFGMKKFETIEFSSSNIPGILYQVMCSPVIIFGFAAFGLGAVLWLFVLAKMELSYAVPLASVTYILVLVAGIILFKEPMSTAKLIGTGLVAGGVVALSWG